MRAVVNNLYFARRVTNLYFIWPFTSALSRGESESDKRVTVRIENSVGRKKLFWGFP